MQEDHCMLINVPSFYCIAASIIFIVNQFTVWNMEKLKY